MTPEYFIIKKRALNRKFSYSNFILKESPSV